MFWFFFRAKDLLIYFYDHFSKILLFITRYQGKNFLYIWKYHQNIKVEPINDIYIVKQNPAYYLFKIFFFSVLSRLFRKDP